MSAQIMGTARFVRLDFTTYNTSLVNVLGSRVLILVDQVLPLISDTPSKVYLSDTPC